MTPEHAKKIGDSYDRVQVALRDAMLALDPPNPHVDPDHCLALVLALKALTNQVAASSMLVTTALWEAAAAMNNPTHHRATPHAGNTCPPASM